MKKAIVILSVFVASSAAIFARIATCPSIILVLYRLICTVLLMLPAAWHARKEFADLEKRSLLLCLASGLFLGLHFTCYFEALYETTIAAAEVLSCMEVLFVALASVLFFRRRLPRAAWLAIGLAFGGTVVIALSNTSGGSGAHPLRGDLFAILAAILTATYTMIGSRCRESVSTTVYTSLVYVAALATVLLLTLVRGIPLTGYGSINLAAGLGTAVFSTLLGHSIYSWALKFLSPSFIATAKLLDPVFGTLWGLLLFQEIPGPLMLAGGIAILAGTVLYSRIET